MSILTNALRRLSTCLHPAPTYFKLEPASALSPTGIEVCSFCGAMRSFSPGGETAWALPPGVKNVNDGARAKQAADEARPQVREIVEQLVHWLRGRIDENDRELLLHPGVIEFREGSEDYVGKTDAQIAAQFLAEREGVCTCGHEFDKHEASLGCVVMVKPPPAMKRQGYQTAKCPCARFVAARKEEEQHA